MDSLSIYGVMVPVAIYLPVVYLLWVTLGLIFKRIIFGSIERFAKKTATRIDDIFVRSADLPLTLLIFTSGGALIERIAPVATDAEITRYFLVGFKVTTILAIILFIDRFINGLISNYSSRIDILKSTGGVARGFARVIVISLGFLILLDSFGVSITPIIASLGVGSLAVALALQPTLENFFSGIQIIVDKPIKVGQFVKLDSGEEGYVHKIGWPFDLD